MAIRRLSNFVIGTVALVAILQTLNVQASVLWTAFTGFAAVGAVAFFAAWSVLSNIFCTFLIFTTRPFRLGDQIELLENGEKPGLKGVVTDIAFVRTQHSVLTDPALKLEAEINSITGNAGLKTGGWALLDAGTSSGAGRE